MQYDTIIIGAGIGGLSAAALLAKAGQRVLVLEANYLPGGCCSSYWRKGYIFEAGATTLMGFDAGQPLDLFQQQLPLSLPLTELDPAMTVWMDGKKVTRCKDRSAWMENAGRVFGAPEAQRHFWQLALLLSDFVWRVSGKNMHFPPTSLTDLWRLIRTNRVSDYPYLRYAFTSTAQVLRSAGLAANEPFVRFLNEQLMITAQSTIEDTPFLFAAPALCYTNYSNYNLQGGMVTLALELIRHIGLLGGSVLLRKQVEKIEKVRDHYEVQIAKGGGTYQTARVLSNLPLWNLPTLTAGKLNTRFKTKADKLTHYWGAFTMGIAVEDTFAEDLTLHHQIILAPGEALPVTGSHSVFVSFSQRGDLARAPAGTRVLAISTHAARPVQWFEAGEQYEAMKATVTEAILKLLEAQLPGFKRAGVRYSTASTPVSWKQWTLRHEGTVGGLPQTLARPLYNWQGAVGPEKDFFLCGDTVYPGQGVPGVTLGGIIAANRILANLG